jgi:hypothetical protein
MQNHQKKRQSDDYMREPQAQTAPGVIYDSRAADTSRRTTQVSRQVFTDIEINWLKR